MLNKRVLLSAWVLVFACAAGALAAGSSGLSLGARSHVDHSTFVDLPYDDGDLSYGLAYEIHESAAYWQVAVLYAPDVSGVETIDYVITPQINLIMKDSFWRMGVGALGSYIRDNETGGDWTDVYWQFIAGISIPLSVFELNAQAYYPFEAWRDIGDFDTDDIEFGGWLTYFF